MENPCYKCGQTVEEGTPFCPHCSAPQIRVAVPETYSHSSKLSSQTAYTESEQSNPEQAVSSSDLSIAIRWPQGLRAAGTAGLIAGLGMTLIGLFGLWMLAAGFLSVVFYRRRTQGGTLRPGEGARLGALSGGMGFTLFGLITVPTGFFRAMMSEMIVKYAQRSDPQFQALTGSWLELLKTPAGVTAWLLGLCLFMIAASAVGGALGSFLLGRRPRT
jgi:hypothetical protein